MDYTIVDAARSFRDPCRGLAASYPSMVTRSPMGVKQVMVGEAEYSGSGSVHRKGLVDARRFELLVQRTSNAEEFMKNTTP